MKVIIFIPILVVAGGIMLYLVLRSTLKNRYLNKVVSDVLATDKIVLNVEEINAKLKKKGLSVKASDFVEGADVQGSYSRDGTLFIKKEGLARIEAVLFKKLNEYRFSLSRKDRSHDTNVSTVRIDLIYLLLDSSRTLGIGGMN